MYQFNSMGSGARTKRHHIKKTQSNVVPTSAAPANPITQAADIQATQLEEAINLLSPFSEAGVESLEPTQAAATPQGLDALINQIMSGELFTGLVDERTKSVESQLAAGGLTRSGEAINEAAAIPLDVAMMIESLLTGRQGGLTNMGLSSTGSIAGLTTQIGEAIASGILGNEAIENQKSEASKTRKNNLIGAVVGGALSGFSDPKLKTNIKVLGKVGPLDLVEWDWKQETQGTIVEKFPTKGFLSTQVKEYYPAYVSSFGGYDVIDYRGLHERLTCQ